MLTLITVCYNNPSELAKTVESVRRQSVRPDQYIVVDSSDDEHRPAMEAAAALAGAEYVWTPPEGVYAAMRLSVDIVSPDSWVWWLNASDWLAGSVSIQRAQGAIRRAEGQDGVEWIVGELLRLHQPTPSVHPVGASGPEFFSMLRSGKTGFPHPSTLFRQSSLAAIAPYEDGLAIASDYGTALRFGKTFGNPLLLTATLTVHNPNGLTSRRPLKNLLEKSRARLVNGSPADRAKEIWRMPQSVVRGLLTRIMGEKPVTAKGARSETFPLIDNEHFCQDNIRRSVPWPACCDALLPTERST